MQGRMENGHFSSKSEERPRVERDDNGETRRGVGYERDWNSRFCKKRELNLLKELKQSQNSWGVVRK